MLGCLWLAQQPLNNFILVFVQIMNNVKHEKGKFAVMTHEACELNVQNTQTTRQKVRL